MFDVSLADLLAKFGFTVTDQHAAFAEVLTVTLPRVGALLPFLMMVLILRVPATRADGDARYMTMLRRHWLWLLALVVLLAFPFLFYDWTKGRHSGFALDPDERDRRDGDLRAVLQHADGPGGAAVVRARRPVRAGRLLRGACGELGEGRLDLAADRTGAAGRRARRARSSAYVVRLAGDQAARHRRSR